ncbi:MAG: BON domain-containing protein [Verrucomicrobiota bacterium]|nr:BON domain-containing protein [Verrucomicrobiota bacterium]
MKKWMWLSTLLLLSCLLSGCAMLEGQDLGDATSDANITAIANSRLNSDVMTANAMLSATVADGLAMLYGTVPDEATRQRAIQLLKATPGVFEVRDRTRRF